MTNFFAMVFYEVKKIIIKKSVWISMVLGLFLVTLVGFTNLSADGHGAYVKYQEKVLLGLSGQPLDQRFLDAFYKNVSDEIQADRFEIYETIYAHDPGAIYLNASSQIGQRALYDLLYNIMRNREKAACATEKELYDALRQNIIDDGCELGSSEKEIESWLAVFDSIEKPIVYSYAQAYLNIIDVLFIVGWALVICNSMAFSGVFADEKAYRTDALILSSRKGRMPVCAAKMAAAAAVAIFQAIILIGGCLGIEFLFYGTHGWNAMIQNVIPSSPWNITIGTMMLIYIALAAVCSVLFAATNLLLSHLTRSSVVTMAIHAAIIFAGLFNMPKSLGWITKMWQLRPTMPLHYGTFCNTYLYGTMNNVEACFVLYGLCIVIFTALLMFFYCRSHPESR